MINNALPIPMRDYERIFRIVHSVSTSIGNIPGKACLFYNTVGAKMLEKNFKKKAQLRMGTGFIRVHDQPETVLSYCRIDDGIPYSDVDGFHCWIQLDDHVIDFAAPVYHESAEKVGCKHSIPRKMFQKKMSTMAESGADLSSEGDYYFEPNIQLTKHLIEKMCRIPAIGDLADICQYWYKKIPKKIPKQLAMHNDLGEVTNIKLSKLQLTGVW